MLPCLPLHAPLLPLPAPLPASACSLVCFCVLPCLPLQAPLCASPHVLSCLPLCAPLSAFAGSLVCQPPCTTLVCFCVLPCQPVQAPLCASLHVLFCLPLRAPLACAIYVCNVCFSKAEIQKFSNLHQEVLRVAVSMWTNVGLSGEIDLVILPAETQSSQQM